MNQKQFSEKLNELFAWCGSEIPKGWEFQISFINGEASFGLHDDNGYSVESEVCTDDLDLVDSIAEHVLYAVTTDCLIKGQDNPGNEPLTRLRDAIGE